MARLTLLSVHPALFYRPGERLSLAELGAARLDGLLIEVGDGYMPVDTVEGADARATGVAHLVPARMAACGPTAAWIHGAGDERPHLHHVRRLSATRQRVRLAEGVVYHERAAEPRDVQVIVGVSVIAPLPTAVELLFAATLPAPGDERRWLQALLSARRELIPPLQEALTRMPRRPGRRRAEHILQAVIAAVPGQPGGRADGRAVGLPVRRS